MSAWIVRCGAACLMLTVIAADASATVYCEIAATAVGFAPLRAAPGDTADLVAEMVPGDEVLLGQDEADGWVDVTFWRGGRFRSGLHPTGDPPTAHGSSSTPVGRSRQTIRSISEIDSGFEPEIVKTSPPPKSKTTLPFTTSAKLLASCLLANPKSVKSTRS